MNYRDLLIIFSSAIISWKINLFIKPWLIKYYPDNPNSRSSHLLVTPRGGGLSFAMILIIISLTCIAIGNNSSINVLPLICTPLAIIGFIDDKNNLPNWTRYCMQFLTAFMILNIRNIQFPDNSILLYIIVNLLLLISITAIINFINFMDGIDGIVTSNLLITFSVINLSLNNPLILLVLIGSLMGFLIINWSPAQIFMGDVGSTFLGALLAGLILQAESSQEAIAFLLLSFPLLLDAFLCVIRRYISNQNIFKAHKLHLYQRLHQGGWSHSKITLLYMSATFILSISYLAFGLSIMIFTAILQVIIGVYIDKYFAYPFNHKEIKVLN